MDLKLIPAIDASLNGAAGCLLLLGYIAVKNKRVDLHRLCMGLALLCSAVFLCFYLYYHFHHGSTKFQGQGPVRPLYFTILISHTILAAAVLPLILRTVYLALRDEVEKHKKIARITFPIWMYVSVTGVVIYWMLYQVKY